ncbi:MAG: CHAP domain-containing protein [Flavobacteriia bacterium]|nr:CHAP domain-containing protein [Flavobacteriia bacterium]
MLKIRTLSILLVLILGALGSWSYFNVNLTSNYEVGEPVDTLNGVVVYYNGAVGNVSGRNTSADGYNIGLKYQCVEFVKRYYLEHLNHKMPNPWGHAVDFYDPDVADGKMNRNRGLIQFSNASKVLPGVKDLIVFEGTTWNPYGHVAIVSAVHENSIEITQQNPGPNAPSRISLRMTKEDDKYKISGGVLGWLRLP